MYVLNIFYLTSDTWTLKSQIPILKARMFLKRFLINGLKVVNYCNVNFQIVTDIHKVHRVGTLAVHSSLLTAGT